MFLADASVTMLATGGFTLALTAAIRLLWRRGKPLEQP